MIKLRGTYPSIIFSDSDNTGAVIHVNSNLFHILRSDGLNGWATLPTGTTGGGYWPYYVDLTNNSALFGGAGTFAGNVTAFSDIKFKENIVQIDNALDKTLKLRGVYYNRTDDSSKTKKIGVIAQEILPIIPEVVIETVPTDPDGTTREPMLSVDYGNLTALLIEAVKDLNNKILSINNRLCKLEHT
jgi:hypothetical protein